MDEFADLRNAIKDEYPEVMEGYEPTAVPTPTPEPEDEFAALREYLRNDTEGVDRALMIQARLENAFGAAEHMDSNTKALIARKIAEEEKRASDVRAGWTAADEGKESKFLDTYTTTGKMIKNLAEFSTTPTKVVTENTAKWDSGKNTFDLENTLASTVNLVKSLAPGGQTPGEALDAFSTKNKEGARAFLNDMYSKDIIDENGQVDIDRLEYSDIPRWAQNELAALWASQRTGIKNIELFRKVLKSRLGVTKDDEMATPAAKRLAQMLDGMLFNLPTKGNKWLRTRAETAVFGDSPDVTNQGKLPMGVREAMEAAPFNEPVFDESSKKWIVHPPNGGTPAVVDNYDPSLPYNERIRIGAKALLDDTIGRMEAQAMEAGPQLLDPSILVGVGLGKKALQSVAKLGKIGASVSSKAAAIAPYAEGAGAITAGAKFARLPKVSQAIVNTARADSAAGVALRTFDKTITAAALVGGLSGLGAPTNMGVDSTIAGSLMMFGFSPLQLASSLKPSPRSLSNANRDALREIMKAGGTGDLSKLSKYSRKYLETQMRDKGFKTPEEFVAVMRSSEALDATIPDAFKRIDESEMTSAVSMEYAKQMASDEKFQTTISEMMRPFDNYGRTWEGLLAFDVLTKTRQEMVDHLAKVTGATPQVGYGSSTAPLAASLKGALRTFNDSISSIPSWLLNDRKKFSEYLKGEVTGQPVDWLQPPIRISPDAAKTALGQFEAVDRTHAYLPLAQIAITTSVALKEQAPLMKSIAIGDMANKYVDLANMYRQADPQELLSFLSEMKGAQVSSIKENPLERILRHSSKAEQEIISPSVASVRVADEIEEAGRLVTAKGKEIEIINEQAAKLIEESKRILGKNFDQDPTYLKNMAAFNKNKQVINDEISDILASTGLGKIFKHTTELTTRYVKHQKALSDAMSASSDEIKAANLELAQATEAVGVKGTKTKQERLLKTSERIAQESRDIINEQRARIQRDLALARMTRDKAVKEITAEAKVLPASVRRGTRSIIRDANANVKAGRGSPKLEDLLKQYRTARNKASSLEGDLRDVEADIITYDSVKDRIDESRENLLKEDWKTSKVDGKWVEDFLVAGKSLGIADNPAYKNIVNMVADHLNSSAESLRKNGNVLGLADDDIAIVRYLGSNTLWEGIYGMKFSKEQKPLMRAFKKRVNVLADTLAQEAWNSRIQADAHQVLIDISKNPARGNLVDLLSADKVLHDTYHIDRILAESKDPKGIFARMQELSTSIGTGKTRITKRDYNTLRVLLTDSGIGKAYVTTTHLEGLGVEPWMVTYKQDSVLLMNNFLHAATAHTDRIVEETSKFLSDAGLISNKDAFNDKMAAAFLFGTVNGAGAGSGALFDLLTLANGWSARMSPIDNPWVPTDSISISLDRAAGISTTADLREIFAASNVSALAKDKWAKPLIARLRTLRSGKEFYQDHMRPSSPVRKMINRMFVGTTDRDMIDTLFPEFARSGYHDGLTFFKLPEHRAGMRPVDAVDRDHVLLTDHLIVNGELTAMGRVFDEIHKTGADPKLVIHNYLEMVIPERKRILHPEEYSALRKYLQERVGSQNNSYGRLVSYDQWNLVKEATKIIQDFDRRGIAEVNAISDYMNKKLGTGYSNIEYNPWRLDVDVVTERDAVTKEPGLLGSWRDADRFAGNKYRTTPDAQIMKAQGSGIIPEEIVYSPEANYLNRFNRLYNDAMSRKARKNLIDKAVFMETIGYNNVANGIKKNILEAGNLGSNEMTWVQKLQMRITGSDSRALAAVGLATRQLFNPMVMLSSFKNTVIEQPLQQMVLAIDADPSVRGVASAALDASRYASEMVVGWPKGFFHALTKDLDKLAMVSNGENMSIGGTHLSILENIYAGQTKRIDPKAQQMLISLQRGGSGAMRSASILSAETHSLEAAAIKSLWAVKERAENIAVRSTLKTLGSIMSTGDKILAEQGPAALVKHLDGFLGGHTNPALIMDAVREIQAGRVDVGWEKFGREYVAARVGTWNATNTPKAIRSIARYVPGADQFFTAATIGSYRMLNSVIGLQNVSSRQKARMVMAALSVAGIASGIGIMQEESGIEWFGRVSPSQILTTATRHAWSNEAAAKDSLTTAFNAIGTRAQIQSGASQGLTMKAVYTLIKGFNDIYMEDMMVEKDRTKTLSSGPQVSKEMKLLGTFIDMTATKPLVSVLNATPTELMATGAYMNEVMRYASMDAVGKSMMLDTDAEMLVKVIDGRFGDARKLADKLIALENETGESPFTRSEELSIALLSLYPRVLESAQTQLWNKYAPGIGRQDLIVHPDDRIAVIAQGLVGGSASSEQLVKLIEKAIARYDERRKRHDAIISGSTAPVVSPGDWRLDQEAADAEEEAAKQ